MKNKLTDLNDHLFAQMERLGEEGITDEKLKKEVERGRAITTISEKIIQNAALRVKAEEICLEYGVEKKPDFIRLINNDVK